MPEINGKQVVFVEQPRADRWWALLPTLQKLQSKGDQDGGAMMAALEWSDVVKLVQASVASWEFEGDPQDPQAIGRLHMFKELMPLIAAFGSMVGNWTATDPN